MPIFNDITTGAQNDLQKATELLRKMITQFGMSSELGPLTFGQQHEHIFLGRDFGHVRDYSEDVAKKIDEEMRRIINGLYESCKKLLLSKRKHLDALAQVLLDKETIEKEEFKEIIEKVDKGTFSFQPTRANGNNVVQNGVVSDSSAPVADQIKQ